MSICACGQRFTVEHAVLRRTDRFVSNDFSPSSSVTSMLNDLKWDNIENRRTTQRLATLHKILHEEIDIPHHNYIQTKPQRSRRTHNKQFNLTNCTSTPFAQSFFPETIKLWNSLPQSTVDVTPNSKKSFQNINSSLLPLSPWLVKLPVIVPSGLFGRRLHKVQGTKVHKVQGTVIYSQQINSGSVVSFSESGQTKYM